MQEKLLLFLEKIKLGSRVLCLDYGKSKIGLALSDVNLIIASAFKVLERKNITKDLNQINDIIKEHNISGIVIGLPIQMNGKHGNGCEEVKNFAKKLVAKLGIEIYFQDERLSTKAANIALSEANLSRKKRNKIDDKVSACFLLQGFLDNVNFYKNARNS